MTKLRISADLSLPEDTVTSTLIVYGGKGMGKTNFGSVLVEELSRAKLRWSFLDPMGVAWGLRYSADGAGPGIECVILGGPHGDMPIEPTGGAVIADFVVDEDVNVLIDFSRKPSGDMWSNGERIRFVTDYTRRLFSRQGQLVNGRRREPLFQILDEAARYIPQVIPAGRSDAFSLADCLGAWEQAVEEGRNIGLGVGLLTQRSARINKSVAELADLMVAFRTVGPNSIEAVTDWLGSHVEKARIKELTGEVRTLPVGSALVVSPGWLGVEKVVPFRARTTFDSSATPKAGERAKRVSGPGAKPDLSKYQARMAETIERAKADDPKELRRKIAELEKDRRELERNVGDLSSGKHIVKNLDDEYRRGLSEGRRMADEERTAARMDGARLAFADIRMRVGQISGSLGLVRDAAENILSFVDNGGTLVKAILDSEPQFSLAASNGRPKPPVDLRDPAPSPPRRVTPPSDSPTTGRRNEDPSAFTIGAGEQRILDAIAELNALGIEPVTREQIGMVAEYKLSTGRPAGYLRALHEYGYIEFSGGGDIQLTTSGRRAARAPQQPLTLKDLHERVLRNLDEGERRILEYLIQIHPRGEARDDLGVLVGYKLKTGRPAGYLRKLFSLGFAENESGQVRAGKLLYPEGLR